jgi:hypothetical protein
MAEGRSRVHHASACVPSSDPPRETLDTDTVFYPSNTSGVNGVRDWKKEKKIAEMQKPETQHCIFPVQWYASE